MGLQSLKGVGRLVEVFGIKGEKLQEPNPQDYKENSVEVHSDDEVPSIAIIQFNNKGADEDAFYSYGISIDLISDISRAGLIKVSSKKQIEDAGELPIDELAKKLDVRYIANGELWRMDDIFQLSVELYDTKDNKVIWSDRWQEKWNHLPTIKGNLSEGLLKSLSSTIKIEKKMDTDSSKAYEYYLKAKFKFQNRKGLEGLEIARGLLCKSIEIDKEFLSAKILLGDSFKVISDYDKAMKIYKDVLSQAISLKKNNILPKIYLAICGVYIEKGKFSKARDRCEKAFKLAKKINSITDIAECYHRIALSYDWNTDFDNVMKYLDKSLQLYKKLGDKRNIAYVLTNKSMVLEKDYINEAIEISLEVLKIREEINDQLGLSYSLGGLASLYISKYDFKKAIKYNSKSQAIKEKLGSKWGLILSFRKYAQIHICKGEYDKAEEYCTQALKLSENISNVYLMSDSYFYMGVILERKCDYEAAIQYYEKSIQVYSDEFDDEDLLEINSRINNLLKKMNKNFNNNEIIKLIEKVPNSNFRLYFILYQLLEDRIYLKKAYNQVQEKADNLEPDIKIKFLGYPIPKTIIEEYNKVFKK